MDLALALVEDDFGREVVRAPARELVLFLRRPGSQSQYSVPLWSRQPASDPIRAAVQAIHALPGSVPVICNAGLPTSWGCRPPLTSSVCGSKAACRALAEGGDTVEAVARRCGLGTAESLASVRRRPAL